MPAAVGLIGAGEIAGQYLDTFDRIPELTVAAIADLDWARAQSLAAAHGAEAVSVAELLADERTEIVLNLTVPAAHAEVSARVLASDKHLWTEKPLSISLSEAEAILAQAERAGLRIGAAPDTFLACGLQTAIDAARSGRIGQVFGATALWGAAGHELWHPSPEFYYQLGGGPVLDMGPYYVTALVQLLGPVARVQAQTLTTGRRRFTRSGSPIAVAVPTAGTAILEHVGGGLSNVSFSFETWGRGNDSFFEAYGTEGSLRLPDPNRFDGIGLVYEANGVRTCEEEAQRQWRPLVETAGFRHGGRGVGVLELSDAVRQGRPHRADGHLALHVLEVLTAINRGGGTIATTVEVAPVLALRDLPPPA
ncbi:MAG: Gfo/Idh/MocA family oxidoreductase [Bifidobacteriaceae bacterium]|jgi:predicted dehydrogenase|nr:Gfo/Idh/MocA family oxidoreductase [Bifidobacteriaceae bacterium]